MVFISKVGAAPKSVSRNDANEQILTGVKCTSKSNDSRSKPSCKTIKVAIMVEGNVTKGLAQKMLLWY